MKKDPDSSSKELSRDWENRVQEQKGQIGDLLTQLIRKNREIEDLEARLDKLENAASHAPKKENLPLIPRKPLDCVQLAQDHFPGELLFLDSARESAGDSPYCNTEELWKHFEVMSQLARIWQEKQGSLGDSFYNVFKRLGLADYKGHLSDTSSSRFRDQYTFTWDGSSHLFEEHFTLGSKDANTCLSIHFLRDEVKQRFVIAHVGRHLANTCS